MGKKKAAALSKRLKAVECELAELRTLLAMAGVVLRQAKPRETR